MADSAEEEECSSQNIIDNTSVSTRKDEGCPEKTNLARFRSYSTVSLAARSKLASLIHLATEAETETDFKKVADTVFDSVCKFCGFLKKLFVCLFTLIVKRKWTLSYLDRDLKNFHTYWVPIKWIVPYQFFPTVFVYCDRFEL